VSEEIKKQPWEDENEMKDEYDFSNSVPSPYAARAGNVHIALLEPDVHAAFPDSQSVNEALRLLIKVAKRIKEPARTS